MLEQEERIPISYVIIRYNRVNLKTTIRNTTSQHSQWPSPEGSMGT